MVDSVESKVGTFRNYPGWQEWLLSVLKEYAQARQTERIIVNKNVQVDLAVKFVKWVEENETPEEYPDRVKLHNYVKKIPMEFVPTDSARIISLRVT